MKVSRRSVLAASAALTPMGLTGAGNLADMLTDGTTFQLEGTYLDAAFTHPFGRFARAAAEDYLACRAADPQGVGPAHNARSVAVGRFARLVGVDPSDVAVVPSTMTGENLVNLALRTGEGAGVVTDALHYDASLALYGELARRGAPVRIVRPRAGRVDLADIRAAIDADTRLVAISLVSSATGFTHDLAELCAVAHAKGAMVYADIAQAVGAIPLDLRASGVDFACAGTYKWLMGDFGTAFLYVCPARLERLYRVEVGWRQLQWQQTHTLPFDPPGPAISSYRLGDDAAALFEVSTPSWSALAIAAASIDVLIQAGVDRLAKHRNALLAHLRDGLRRSEWTALTPEVSAGPIITFARRDAAARYKRLLEAANIKVSMYAHSLRVSPSIYNNRDDIDRLVTLLRR